MAKDNVIKVLNDREHVLLRPNMYIGSLNLSAYEDFILNSKYTKFEYEEVKVVPALLKMFGEVIDNSIDEAIRTDFKKANKIQINITNNSIEIIDNGRGIPIELEKTTNEYGPVLAWTRMKAGGNFESDDSGRSTMGMNGVGVSLVNIMSKLFIASTQYKKQKLTLTSKDNMETYSVEIEDSLEPSNTKVKFFPDFERLEIDEINDVHMRLIRQRIYVLSIIYPKITFSLNGVVIKNKKNKDFLEMFNEVYEYFETDDYIIGVFPNDKDDFKFFSYVNGLNMKNGGNHINMILNNITSSLKDLLTKKHPSIKPGDIKNKIQLVVMFKNFKNFETNSQTKESLDNSVGYIKTYLGDSYKDNIEKLVKRVSKRTEIIKPITDIYKLKEELKEQEILEKEDKKLSKKIKSKKFTKSTNSNKYLFIVEGESALSGLMSVLGRVDYSYYELKGKPLNSFDITNKKLLDNQELNELREILGMSLSGHCDVLKFEDVVIAADNDLDGYHITALLLAFFYRFGKSMLNNIKILNTPIAIAKRGTTIKEIFMTIDEINNYTPKEKGINILYKKGLGSWKKEEFLYIFKKYGIDYFLSTMVFDDKSTELISHWFGKDNSDFRKEYLKNNKFSLSKL